MLVLIWVIFSFALLIFYVLLIRYYRSGWDKIHESPNATPAETPFASIIVPARDEENNILNCLNTLVNQDFPNDSFEIIVVDDHSTDNTADLVGNWLKGLPVGIQAKMVSLSEMGVSGSKKTAILTAIESAKGEIIITTDADCEMGSLWLKSMVSFFTENDAALVSGPVRFIGGDTLFEKFQSLEFCGLIGIGAAALANSSPNMCNGANIAYRKDAFFDVGGFEDNRHIASGDDEFLMHKIFRSHPGRVFFLKSEDAIVNTRPNKNLRQFFRQRKRWVSKSSLYQNKKITLVMGLTWLFNLTVLVNLAGGIFAPIFIYLVLFQLTVKFISEYFFYRRLLSFFSLKRLMPLLFFTQFFHITYVVLLGFISKFGDKAYVWKGRRVR